MPTFLAGVALRSGAFILLPLLACGGANDPHDEVADGTSMTSFASSTATPPPAATSSDHGTTTNGRPDAGAEGDAGSDSTARAPPTTTTTTTGGDPPSGPLEALSDEFEDDASLADWTLLSDFMGEAPRHARLLISGGQLMLEPLAGGWFEDYQGPMLFKVVSGDFVMEARVQAVSPDNDASPPDRPFNSAGLIVADPATVPGTQNWITHNVGRQSEIVATEGKNTVDSNSVLELIPGIHHGRLRICRIGNDFILARRLDDEDAFEIHHHFVREDLPAELWVGMMANGWNSLGGVPNTELEPDVVGMFDYVRFWTPQSDADCVD
jgi:hypothetical protein